MDPVIRVDASDTAPCNLRCARQDNTYCNGYPKCIAGQFHRVQDWFRPGQPARKVVREERKRSALGGHSMSRIVQSADGHSTVEEVELHCQTLQFESLLKTVPVEAKKPGAPKKA